MDMVWENHEKWGKWGRMMFNVKHQGKTAVEVEIRLTEINTFMCEHWEAVKIKMWEKRWQLSFWRLVVARRQNLREVYKAENQLKRL
jgi:hypothetical protein